MCLSSLLQVRSSNLDCLLKKPPQKFSIKETQRQDQSLEGFCLTSSLSETLWVMVVVPTPLICSTEIVSLILSLQSGDEQDPCIGRHIFGSREVAGDPGDLVQN